MRSIKVIGGIQCEYRRSQQLREAQRLIGRSRVLTLRLRASVRWAAVDFTAHVVSQVVNLHERRWGWYAFGIGPNFPLKSVKETSATGKRF